MLKLSLAHTRTRVLLKMALPLVVFLALALPAHAAGDMFSNFANTVANIGKNLAGGLIIIGALVAGGSIIAGSQQSGKHAKDFFLGAAFLGLVAIGTGLYSMVSGWFQ